MYSNGTGMSNIDFAFYTGLEVVAAEVEGSRHLESDHLAILFKVKSAGNRTKVRSLIPNLSAQRYIERKVLDNLHPSPGLVEWIIKKKKMETEIDANDIKRKEPAWKTWLKETLFSGKDGSQIKTELAESRKAGFKEMAEKMDKSNNAKVNQFSLLKKLSGYKGCSSSGGLVNSVMSSEGRELYNEEKDKALADQYARTHGGEDQNPSLHFPNIPLSYNLIAKI